MACSEQQCHTGRKSVWQEQMVGKKLLEKFLEKVVRESFGNKKSLNKFWENKFRNTVFGKNWGNVLETKCVGKSCWKTFWG